MLLVSYLFILWLHLFQFSVCWDYFCGKMCWYFSIVSGRKFVLVLIFPVYFVVASGGNFFWFLYFQQLNYCIWRGSMFFVPIFPAFMWPHLAGSLFWFLFFQRLLWYYLLGSCVCTFSSSALYFQCQLHLYLLIHLF